MLKHRLPSCELKMCNALAPRRHSINVISFFSLHFKWSSYLPWRRQWHPTPVLSPGKSHGRRSLVGFSPRGREELDTTEWLHFHFSLSCIGEGNGNPLQCSCLENPRDGGAWWASVYGVAQSQRWLKWLSSSSSSSSNISSQCEVYPDVPQSLNISFLLTNNKFLLLIYLEKGKWGVFPPTCLYCIICTVLQNEAKSTWHRLETVW